jgi:hypothetical protein
VRLETAINRVTAVPMELRAAVGVYDPSAPTPMDVLGSFGGDGRTWVRRELCDQGYWAPGEGRYHWTVTVFEGTDAVAAGRTGELGQARSQAETALGGSGSRQ